MLDTIRQDLRYGARLLLKNRTVTFAAVLTLTIGIGSNTAIFSVVNAVLLSPLPYSDSERLVSIRGTSALRGLYDIPLSEPEFMDIKDQSQSFENAAAYASGTLNLTDIEEPERVGVTEASAGLFPALGVAPLLGRVFSAEEDLPGREPVTVVSYRLWQRHYGSDPGLVGKTISLNGRPRVVVGVMPKGFKFPNDEIDVWMPLNLNPADLALGAHYLDAVARLKPGATVEQAKVEAATIYNRVKIKYPEYYKGDTGAGATAVTLREEMVGDIRPALLLLLGAVAFMLLIACANVANLLLARAAGRQREIALRLALGASRARIIRQLLTESLMLSVIGGVFGWLLAVLGLYELLARSPLDPLRVVTVRLDLPTLGVTMLVTLVAGVLFGLAPALQASKTDLSETLKEGGRGSMQSLHHNRTRNLLVVAEVALSMVLLIGAGLMVNSFLRLLNVDPGFQPQNLLTMRFTLPAAKYPENRQVAAFFQQLQERVGTLPGVQSSVIINQLPIAADKTEASFEIEGRRFDSEIDREAGIADYRIISPAYFRTMGIPFARGRAFNEQDGKQSPPVAIINERLSRRFWPAGDALDKRIRLRPDAPWLPIVGVVPDIKNQGLNSETTQEMYFPYSETSFGLGPPQRSMTLVIRTTSDPSSLTNVVRSEVRSIDKDLPAYKTQTMEQAIATSVAKPRFTMLLLAIFAVLALILAAVGVYSVMSYSVAQRTHELGIRKALGAQPRDIFQLIMGQGFVLAVIGVAAGVVAAFALTRLMSQLLYNVSATDPTTFIGIALLLTTVALLACYLPARKATKVSPMTALRHE